MRTHRNRNRSLTRTTLALITAGLLAFATPLVAGDKNPYAMADETWINLNGTVESVAPNSFVLDYGDGIITVEMDDGDRDADAYKLLEGDTVSVSGMIDDDFYETTTIEASSVYVEKLNTHFYASSVDEEDTRLRVTYPLVLSKTTVQGVITEIDGDEFVLSTGLREVTVDVDEMPYDPLDNEGYQKLDIGDHVSVVGEIDVDFWEGRELKAETIVTHRS